MLKDPILDWLKHTSANIYINKEKKESDTHLQTLFEMGNKFEECVFKKLYSDYPEQVVKVVQDGSYVKPEDMDTTFKYMLEGYPVILQAALYNYSNYSFGVADILVRSDKINSIFNAKYTHTMHVKAPNLKPDQNYHYVVIDIKWTTLMLCSDGVHIRNSQRFPAYKGQLSIYNAALGILQGYTPDKAFILAKGYRYQETDKIHLGYNCFDLLGVVDYASFDMQYIDLTKKAIDWVRDVRYNGRSWTCYPPSRPELYPNMCNRFDVPYHRVKQEISDRIDEITQIWMVGVKNREFAFKNGITKWSDPDCSSETLGVNGKRIGPIVNQIINVNRTDNDKCVIPTKIKNNSFKWQTRRDSTDFYIDFETINGCFYDKDVILENSKKENGVIFMIGVGYNKNKKWCYKCFTMTSFNLQEEFKVIQQFVDFIDKKVKHYKYPRLFHWGHAEISMFKACNARHGYPWTKWLNKMLWVDFCKIFQTEPITVKNAKKFNLKEITNALHKNGLISTSWLSTGLTDGLTAMINAANYYKFMERYSLLTDHEQKKRKNYKEWLSNEKAYIDIINYNETDCKAVHDIVEYLRCNHT